MSVPTTGETYSRLMEFLRKAQEESATMAHLVHAQGTGDRELARQWLSVSENFKKMQNSLTKLAMGRMQ
jgi:hypothetical protein